MESAITNTRMLVERHSRAWGTFLVFFILLYPFLVLPEHLLRPLLHPGRAVVLPNLELIHLFPRLLLLLTAAALGWRYWRFRSLFALLLLLQPLLLLLGSLASGDPDSWLFPLLGPQQRLDGLLYQLALAALALAIYGFLTSRAGRERWRMLLTALIISGALQALLVIAQRIGLEPIGGMLVGERYAVPRGTLSHPGMVSGFLLPILVSTVGLLIERPRPARDWFWGLLVVVLALGLGATGNRSGFFALAPALALLVLLFRSARSLLVGGAVVATALLGNYGLPVLGAVGEARSYTEGKTLQTRMLIWRLAARHVGSIPSFPLLGGGPDALRLMVLEAVPPEEYIALERVEEGWSPDVTVLAVEPDHSAGPRVRDTLYRVRTSSPATDAPEDRIVAVNLDKAHNAFFDRLLTSGLIGMLALLALYVVPLFRLYRRPDGMGATLIAALTALLVYYQAWFPVVQVEPLHFVIIAAAWALASAPEAAGW